MTVAAVFLIDAAKKLDRPFDYIADIEGICVGSLVLVPFGARNRLSNGVCVGLRSTGNPEEETKLKSVSCVSEVPPISAELMSLAYFMRERTLCTFGDAIRTMIPPDALKVISERYVICGGEERAMKLSTEALVVYSFIRERRVASRESIRNSLGQASMEILDKLLSSKLVTAERTQKPVTNVKYETVISLEVDRDEAERILSGSGSVKIRGKNRIELLERLLSEDEVICDSSILNAAKYLCEAGIARSAKHEVYRDPYTESDGDEKEPPRVTYSEEQSAAIEKLCELARGDKGSGALLHGITGSGKTLVIRAVIDFVLKSGRGAIVLVPEIALTPQTVGVYRSFFGNRIAVIHSSLSAGERFDAWRRILRGDASVVIGTRSAVFAPVKNLGLIVIDEEQEHTYKSDTSPKYLAHDIARKRCADTNSLMLLASATPSLTSYYKAKTGVYSLVELKNRYRDAHLPRVDVVDMRNELKGGNYSIVSDELALRLKETVSSGNQAILFLNRRGYNSVLSCRRCGENVKCPNCSVSLTYHATSFIDEDAERDSSFSEDGKKKSGEYLRRRSMSGYLVCHYCGYRCGVVTRCPSCSDGHLLFMGYGTQRAQAELERLISGIRVLRMDTDTTRKKFSHDEILTSFRNHGADVLLGTQMVTKGHDFPKVALVGVLNADSSLFLDDYRASERTFDMLTQVVGRAGRSGGDGIAVIQTSNPSSEVISLAAVQDYPTFYEREILLRRAAQFPPFCDICVISVSSKDEVLLNHSVTWMNDELRRTVTELYPDVTVQFFGPIEAPVYKVQTEYRMRFVVKCKLNRRAREMFAHINASFVNASHKGVTVSIDFNPSGM